MTPNRFRFRAWDPDGKRMLSRDTLAKHRVGFVIHVFSLTSDPVACELEHGEPRPNWILMQSTGLVDKNGKEIFEGDIVRKQWGAQGPCKECPKGHQVFRNHSVTAETCGDWNTLRWKISGCDNHWRGSEVEVIGNVYENPELLK